MLSRSIGRVGEEGSRHRVLDVTVPVASDDHRHQIAVLGCIAVSLGNAVASKKKFGSDHNSKFLKKIML